MLLDLGLICVFNSRATRQTISRRFYPTKGSILRKGFFTFMKTLCPATVCVPSNWPEAGP